MGKDVGNNTTDRELASLSYKFDPSISENDQDEHFSYYDWGGNVHRK